MSMPIVSLDCETTSLNRWTRRPWEIGIIRRDENGNESRRHLMITDVDLSDADPFSLKIGHFYDRHPRYTLSSDEVWTRATELQAARVVEEWTRGAGIIGFNPAFDDDVMANMLHRHGLLWNAHYHVFDVKMRAVGYLAGKGQPLWPPYGTEELAKLLDVDPPEDKDRHTALGDAAFALRMHDRITQDR